MSKEHLTILDKAYNDADLIVTSHEKIYPINISDHIQVWVDIICQNMNNLKALITVLITSLTEKIVNPHQDVRRHQQQIENGYSGRTLDTLIITPFLKSKQVVSMSESGWLTRSLEQPLPYDLNYPGKINNKEAKQAFLNILHDIEENNGDAYSILCYVFQWMIFNREANKISIDTQINIS